MDFRKLSKLNVIKSYFLLVTMAILLIVVIDLISLYFNSTYSLLGVTTMALIFSVFSTFISYYNSDKIVLKMTKAIIIDHEANPQLYNLVEEMALASGVKMPKVGIVTDDAPNAFATGRDEDHGVIVFTTSILDLMDREELQGVVAHELSHIKNRDTLVSAIVTSTAGLIAVLSDVMLRIVAHSSSNRKNSNPFILPAILIAMILAPIAALLIQAAVSRKRESLADASAVAFTRNPAGLRKALEKLQSDSTVVQARANSVAHLWIESPLPKKKLNLFATHPTIQSRIETLRAME